MDIPITNAMGYLGVAFFLAGSYLVVSGTGIIRIDKITVARGAKTVLFGFLALLIGITFIILSVINVLPVSPATTYVQLTETDLEITYTPTPTFTTTNTAPTVTFTPTAIYPSETPGETPTVSQTTTPELQPTSLPMPTQISTPIIKNFQACPSVCTGQNSSKVFEPGIQMVHVVFDYENFKPGGQYSRTWSSNGEVWVQYNCAWDGRESGIESIQLRESGGLRSGIWELKIIHDGFVVLQESITVTGSWTYYSTPGLKSTCH
ncbi:MAG TPA: hypothetical protein VIO36_09360 [Anaerolineaceae bacterium]